MNLRLLLILTILALAPARAEDPASLLRQIDAGFVAVFEKVAPAVVIIEAEKKVSDDSDTQEPSGFDSDHAMPFDMPQQPVKSEGSGFLIRPDGYLITNNHVIEDSEKLTVKLKDGRTFPAKIIGVDDKTDIAVLKIEATDLPATQLGDSDSVRVGQLVCAIGVPYNLDYSFTCGWISAKGRAGLTNTLYEDYLQTDAFINPGNSGGPLLDVDGHVIGMNTLINGIARGLAFAIPSNMIRQVSDQLIATGKITRPWIGIRMDDLAHNPELQAQIKGVASGVIVQTIEPNAPAWKSDLRPADIITSVDGIAITRASELQHEILKKKIGQTLQLAIWREGKSLKIPVTTGELPATLTRGHHESEPPALAPDAHADASGLRLENVPADTLRRLKLPGGARVAEVLPDSPAAAEILPDDIITDIAQHPVKDADTARHLLAHSDLREGVLIFLNRRGVKTYTVLSIRNQQTPPPQ